MESVKRRRKLALRCEVISGVALRGSGDARRSDNTTSRVVRLTKLIAFDV